MTKEELIDFINREERRYRSAAQAEPLLLQKVTDLKTAELYTAVGEMLEDYLLKDSTEKDSILKRYGIPETQMLKEAS